MVHANAYWSGAAENSTAVDRKNLSATRLKYGFSVDDKIAEHKELQSL